MVRQFRETLEISHANPGNLGNPGNPGNPGNLRWYLPPSDGSPSAELWVYGQLAKQLRC